MITYLHRISTNLSVGKMKYVIAIISKIIMEMTWKTGLSILVSKNLESFQLFSFLAKQIWAKRLCLCSGETACKI